MFEHCGGVCLGGVQLGGAHFSHGREYGVDDLVLCLALGLQSGLCLRLVLIERGVFVRGRLIGEDSGGGGFMLILELAELV